MIDFNDISNLTVPKNEFFPWLVAIVSAIASYIFQYAVRVIYRGIWPSEQELSEFGKKVMELLQQPNAAEIWRLRNHTLRLDTDNCSIGTSVPNTGVITIDGVVVNSALTRRDRKCILRKAYELREEIERVRLADTERVKRNALANLGKAKDVKKYADQNPAADPGQDSAGCEGLACACEKFLNTPINLAPMADKLTATKARCAEEDYFERLNRENKPEVMQQTMTITSKSLEEQAKRALEEARKRMGRGMPVGSRYINTYAEDTNENMIAQGALGGFNRRV